MSAPNGNKGLTSVDPGDIRMRHLTLRANWHSEGAWDEEDMRLSRYPGLAVAIALVGLLCFAGTTAFDAQTTSASVFGTVKDSQGGVLPGATVTLTSRTQGNTLTATTRRRRALRVPDRAARHTTRSGHHAGLQDRGADERGRERERQVLRRRHRARSRRHRGERQRQRAASASCRSSQRRALLHAGERGAQEHRHQRAHRCSTSRSSCRACSRRTPTPARNGPR